MRAGRPYAYLRVNPIAVTEKEHMSNEAVSRQMALACVKSFTSIGAQSIDCSSVIRPSRGSFALETLSRCHRLANVTDISLEPWRSACTILSNVRLLTLY